MYKIYRLSLQVRKLLYTKKTPLNKYNIQAPILAGDFCSNKDSSPNFKLKGAKLYLAKLVDRRAYGADVVRLLWTGYIDFCGIRGDEQPRLTIPY